MRSIDFLLFLSNAWEFLPVVPEVPDVNLAVTIKIHQFRTVPCYHGPVRRTGLPRFARNKRPTKDEGLGTIDHRRGTTLSPRTPRNCAQLATGDWLLS